ncbi:MAG: hypothetical protein M3P11_06825 [Actinomycetota bacterium]|nr:hypothetical protein [Actinomycetota bacterium]
MRERVNRKRRSIRVALPRVDVALTMLLSVLLLITFLPTPAAAQPNKLTPNGQLDFTYGSTVEADGTAASGEKPESKLFYTTDGVVRWWAVLGTSGPSPTAGVWLFELVDHAWVSRVQLPGAAAWEKADTLFENNALYVSLRDNKSPTESDLYEIPYLGNGSWGTIAGPFKITSASPEALTIAKDSAGRLWTTYEKSTNILVGYTAPGGTSFTFTTISKTKVNSDDISAVTSFGGNKIGVFWSDQVAKKDFFAWRADADPATAAWTIETAYGGGAGGCPTANSNLCSDDHMNIKVLGDTIYVSAKTSLNDTSGAPNDPQIVLLRRTSDGTWSAFTVSRVSQATTRAVTLLSPDQDKVWVWSTRGSGETDVWESSLSSPGFTSSTFTSWIKTAGVNNSTTTKQPVTASTGAVVEASVSGTGQYKYWHNEFLPTGTAPSPTISGFSPGSGPVGTSVTITGSNLTGASAMNFFNNVSASFTVDSDTQITATVPSGATTGPISVTTLGGTATSSTNFTVSASAPTISGISPSFGPEGTSVTITGSNLTGASAVSFSNNVSAPFTVDSDTQISTTVPTGAATGPISVTAPGGSVSSGTFTVTTSSGSAISEVQRAFASAGSSAISATFGLTPAQGDLLVAVPINASSGTGSVTFSPPVGWSVGRSNGRAAIFYKVAGASEPKNVTVSDSDGQTYTLRMSIYELSGVDATNPFDQSGEATFSSTTSTTISTDGITDRTGEWAVAMIGWNGAITNGSQSFDNGFTVFTGNGRGYAATSVLAVAGIASTTASWTTASAGVKIVGTFRPAPAP